MLNRSRAEISRRRDMRLASFPDIQADAASPKVAKEMTLLVPGTQSLNGEGVLQHAIDTGVLVFATLANFEVDPDLKPLRAENKVGSLGSAWFVVFCSVLCALNHFGKEKATLPPLFSLPFVWLVVILPPQAV